MKWKNLKKCRKYFEDEGTTFEMDGFEEFQVISSTKWIVVLESKDLDIVEPVAAITRMVNTDGDIPVYIINVTLVSGDVEEFGTDDNIPLRIFEKSKKL